MAKQIIDEELIDRIRLRIAGTVTYFSNFDNPDEDKIVPSNLTHEYLLRNYKIDDSILRHYHYPIQRHNLISDNEYNEILNKYNCVGSRDRIIRPYAHIIYGAYYQRVDFTTKLYSVLYSYKPKTINNKEVKYFEDIIPYFKEYARGFRDGFDNFLDTQISPYLNPYAGEQSFAGKVFEYVTKTVFLGENWISVRGFVTNQNEEIVCAFEDGQIHGYFYRAWTIIFSQNNLFAPLFHDYYQENKTTLTPVLPDALNTDKAKAYLGKAIEIGLISGDYKWLGGSQLLAYFAQKMSVELGLGNGIDSAGRVRISWRPFEVLFNIKFNKLRLNYNDLQKAGNNPSKKYLVDQVFE